MNVTDVITKEYDNEQRTIDNQLHKIKPKQTQFWANIKGSKAKQTQFWANIKGSKAKTKPI